MTIKKSVLGLMAITFLIGATACQAEKLTVREYNHAKDEKSVQKLITEHLLDLIHKNLNLIKNEDGKNAEAEYLRIKNDIPAITEVFTSVLNNNKFKLQGLYHFVLESSAGIHGFVTFNTNTYCEDCDPNYCENGYCENDDISDGDCQPCDDHGIPSINMLLLEKSYITTRSFQKLLNECIKKMQSLDNKNTINLSHLTTGYQKEYSLMLKKSGFNLINTYPRVFNLFGGVIDDLIKGNKYEMIIQ